MYSVIIRRKNDYLVNSWSCGSRGKSFYRISQFVFDILVANQNIDHFFIISIVSCGECSFWILELYYLKNEKVFGTLAKIKLQFNRVVRIYAACDQLSAYGVTTFIKIHVFWIHVFNARMSSRIQKPEDRNARIIEYAYTGSRSENVVYILLFWPTIALTDDKFEICQSTNLR